MILYSIVSPYDIFCTGDSPKTSFRAIKGGLIEYSEQNGIKTARRLISTDPFMYLDSRYSLSANLSGK